MKKTKIVYIVDGDTVKNVQKVLNLYSDDDIVKIINTTSAPLSPTPPLKTYNYTFTF